MKDVASVAPQTESRGAHHETNGDDRSLFVVGIGASAGGLEALERFFERMPIDSGMAFVVVQHLSPDFKSLMDELLARRTTIPIYRVENGMEVKPDAIYLLPPKKDMILVNGKLLLTDKEPNLTMPIDHFFRSLAQDVGDRAIGIVMSGTGSDGSRGIRDIHEVGGLVIVQSLESSKFDGMPKSALQTGLADYILDPEEMAKALVDYARHPWLRSQFQKTTDPALQTGMDGVFRLLRDAYGIDFSLYKPNTVARRTERRLLLNRSPDLDDYLERLRNDPDELSALYRDLLIGVTHFFRDRDAFDLVRKDILPKLLSKAGVDDEIRIWVAGCATGEEAFSLAILILETLEVLKKHVNVKVFATDVHRASLEAASVGVYSRECLADVTPERLKRFFILKGDEYQVCPDLRKMVVFAHHNLIKDAPFTKLDLISCRNLLIYFQPHAQKKILSLFHFGLKTGGLLLLGPSETPGELSDEFETLDNRWKLYRKRRDVRLPADMRLALPVPAGRVRAGGGPRLSPVSDSSVLSVYDAILDKHMPPSLLVNEQRQLVHSFGGAGRYLQVRDGRHSADVLDMVATDLRMALTGALSRASAEVTPVFYKGLRIHTRDGDKLVNVTVEPIRSRGADPLFMLIQLEEIGAAAPVSDAQELSLRDSSEEHLLSLETELRYTKENLQATIEELETSNEELQATNEELVASNEELQSTNEELHSVNEELYTVNAEYQKKITELTELTADMENLLVSADVHTIFLDRDLCVRKFTPRVAEVFHLMPQDLGRRIDNFSHSLKFSGLVEHIQNVLRSGEPFEEQVMDRRGSWYLLRLLPYRTGQGVQGVVLTLLDINRLKQAEASMRQLDERLSAILRHSPHMVFLKDLQGRYVVVDQAFRELTGSDPIGKTTAEVFSASEARGLADREDLVSTEGAMVESEVIIRRPNGPHTYLCVKFPVRDDAGHITGIGGINTDITRLKQAEREMREAVEQRDRFLAMLSHELRNPLAAIVNATAVIESVGARTSEAWDWFKVIERRARHMARMLDDLLDVARVTQNKVEIRKKVIDLRDSMSDCLEEIRNLFHDRQVELVVERPDYPILVEGDPDRLQQVQVNLLTNAAKHTPPGGQVVFQIAREEDDAVIRVRDTGAGIAPSMLERIFDLFVQVDTTLDRTRGGLGVGLTLVRSLVEMHGGQVKAFSAGVGKGSEFVIRLPLTTKVLDHIPRDGGQRMRPGGLSILVVEDDRDVRESLRTLLEMDGHQVRGAGDGAEALRELQCAMPDLALVDIGLPEMDGYELARRVRKQFHQPLVLVALTGYGRRSDRKQALEAGFDHHLTKPVKPRDLYRTLQEIGQGRDGDQKP